MSDIRQNIIQRQRQTYAQAVYQGIELLCLNCAELDEWVDQALRRNPALLRPGMDDRAKATLASIWAREEADPETPPGFASLHEHVIRQIGLLDLTPQEIPVAMAFLEALEPWGWIDQSTAQIALDQGSSVQVCEAVLAKLQQMEPAGLFARNLVDCLTLQLLDRALFDPTVERVLSGLGALEHGGLDALAEAADLSRAEVADKLILLRQLDPKPGLKFGADHVPYRAADARLIQVEGAWQVLPIRQRAGTRLDVDPSAGLLQDRRDAQMIKRALDFRRTSIIRVCRIAVEWQRPFLNGMRSDPVPVTQSKVADTTGLSRATINRVVNTAIVEHRGRSLPLRALFPRDTRIGDEKHDRAEVMSRLRQIVAAEAPDSPLSDLSIRDRLSRAGIKISRRAVTKYRAKLGLPASHMRRLK